MVDAIGGASMRHAILPNSAAGQQVKIVATQATPEQKALMADSDRRSADVQAIDKEYKDAWAKKTSGQTGMQLGDVSKQSPREAAGNLAAMSKLRDVYGENGLQISATRADEKTTSLNTYISWLRERAGAAQIDDKLQTSLFSLKV